MLNPNAMIAEQMQAIAQPPLQREITSQQDHAALFSALLNDKTIAQTAESEENPHVLNNSEHADENLKAVLQLLLSLSENDWKEWLGDELYTFLETDIAEWQETVRLENLSAEEALLALLAHFEEFIHAHEGEAKEADKLQPFVLPLIHLLVTNANTEKGRNQNVAPSDQLARLGLLSSKQLTMTDESHKAMAQKKHASQSTSAGKIEQMLNDLIQRLLRLGASKQPLRLSGQDEQTRALNDFIQRLRGQGAGRQNAKQPLRFPLEDRNTQALAKLIQRLTVQEDKQGSVKQKMRYPAQHISFFQPGPMDHAQQLNFHTQLKNNQGPSTFVEQLENLFATSRLQTFRNGTTTLNVRLYPDHLGSLAIKLVHVNGELVARITAETASAKRLIESQLHQLRQAFTNQQMNVEKIEVTQSQPHNLQNQQQEEKEQQSRGNDSHPEQQGSQGKNDEYEDSEEEDSFRAWLNALTV